MSNIISTPTTLQSEGALPVLCNDAGMAGLIVQAIQEAAIACDAHGLTSEEMRELSENRFAELAQMSVDEYFASTMSQALRDQSALAVLRGESFSIDKAADLAVERISEVMGEPADPAAAHQRAKDYFQDCHSAA
ncbi:hypothetical protein K8F61_09440 [Microbacterium resistens]|uniref:Uncharacterized protein n=1 Tax=Microbacterium resistens TaxID=156977 RepID=A0ABY3RZ82_9MICO|nr:hypothetical protein [Microbacterium resistens]UGS28351.1 hypothetical protein K8F61_09440 [Microbacterium resistens]